MKKYDPFEMDLSFLNPITSLTLQETNISPQKWHFEDDFPFPQVGYVSSLEGSCFFLSPFWLFFSNRLRIVPWRTPCCPRCITRRIWRWPNEPMISCSGSEIVPKRSSLEALNEKTPLGMRKKRWLEPKNHLIEKENHLKPIYMFKVPCQFSCEQPLGRECLEDLRMSTEKQTTGFSEPLGFALKYPSMVMRFDIGSFSRDVFWMPY